MDWMSSPRHTITIFYFSFHLSFTLFLFILTSFVILYIKSCVFQQSELFQKCPSLFFLLPDMINIMVCSLSHNDSLVDHQWPLSPICCQSQCSTASTLHSQLVRRDTHLHNDTFDAFCFLV